MVSIQRNTSRRLLTLHNNTGSSTKRKANPEFLIQTIYKSKCQNHTTLLSYILCTILHCSTQTAKDLHSTHYVHFALSYSVVFYVAVLCLIRHFELTLAGADTVFKIIIIGRSTEWSNKYEETR